MLLICDEVMCGWGRTGEWFVSSAEGITPDILTTAKGISSAYVPLGLTATTQEIADFFDDNYFAHGHTYEAHPITLGPAVAAIKEYKRLGLLERTKEVGERFGKKLREVCAKHPSVGDVRGRGLFWAVELVKDQASRTPFNTQAEKLAGVHSRDGPGRGEDGHGWASCASAGPATSSSRPRSSSRRPSSTRVSLRSTPGSRWRTRRSSELLVLLEPAIVDDRADCDEDDEAAPLPVFRS